MRPIDLMTIVALSLSVAACSKPTQQKTGEDLKAMGHEIGDAARGVAATPAKPPNSPS